ncbi:MAG: prepilin-type N-terminal cleavage/methylation domain-containing protein [Geobacteraceae bacterium]|jgi:prepilin-type N-terminal cleavage/methylation domain-containing protein
MKKNPMARYGDKGFTMVEMLICVIVMSILFAMAIPTMHEWVNKYDCRQTARQITSMFREARNLAISNNLQFMVVVNPGTNSFAIYQADRTTGAYSTYPATPYLNQQPKASGTALIKSGALGTATANVFVKFNTNGTATFTDQNGNASDNNVSVMDGTTTPQTQIFLITVTTTGRISLQRTL